MNLSYLDKQNLQAIRKDLDMALLSVAKKYGIVLKTGRCRFTDSSAQMNIEIATVSSTGEVIDIEKASLLANLSYLGLTHEHLSKTFSIGGKNFKLVGYKKARHVKPFGLTCMEDGRFYVCRAADLRLALGLTVGYSRI